MMRGKTEKQREREREREWEGEGERWVDGVQDTSFKGTPPMTYFLQLGPTS
jgi:hypothetical protein